MTTGPLLFVTVNRDLYGSERALVEIVESLPPSERGPGVHALLPEGGPLSAELAAAGARIHEFRRSSTRLGRLAGRALAARRIRKLGPGAVYFNEASWLRLSLKVARTGIPVTVHVRTLEEAAFVARLDRGSPIRYVAISRFVAGRLPLPADRVEVLHDGFARTDLRPAEAREPRPVTAAVLGRLVPAKGQEFVLEAVAAHGVPEGVRIEFVGGDPESPAAVALRSAIERSGLADRVAVRPFERDLSKAYGRVDLVLIPSVAEPLGRTWFESVACGLPLLVSSEGGPAELGRLHAIGRTYLAGDGADFVAALRRAAAELEPDRQMVIARRDEILRHHRMDTYVDRLLDIIRRR